MLCDIPWRYLKWEKNLIDLLSVNLGYDRGLTTWSAGQVGFRTYVYHERLLPAACRIVAIVKPEWQWCWRCCRRFEWIGDQPEKAKEGNHRNLPF